MRNTRARWLRKQARWLVMSGGGEYMTYMAHIAGIKPTYKILKRSWLSGEFQKILKKLRKINGV